MDSSCCDDLSLLVWSTIDVQGLERWDQSRWEEEATNKGGVDKISGCSTVDEGSCYNSSHSVS